MRLCFQAISFLFVLICLTECSYAQKSKTALIMKMKDYDRLILKTDADSISLLFNPDGKLGDVARGRDSIRKFLYRFKDFKVLYQLSTADAVTIINDTAYVSGSYHQQTIIPRSDTISVHGTFTSIWEWTYKNGWLIQRIDTHPIR